MAQKKVQRRCPKCGMGKNPKQWGKKFGLVCGSCEHNMIFMAHHSYHEGGLGSTPPLTDKEREIYSQP